MSLAQITMAGSLTTPTVSDDSTLVNSSRRGSSTTPNHSTHEYELNQSDSIDFCFNLMSDPLSNLSQTDIMDIFNVFHKRQTDLQFSVNDNKLTDIQGLKLSKELRRKLDLDRVRIGNRSKRGWFHNLSSSREKVRKSLNLLSYESNTDFFEFNKFYSRLKLNITHFQLRNLVCCGKNVSRGIYYPLIYFRDSQLQFLSAANRNMEGGLFGVPTDEDDLLHQYFRINRLSPDVMAVGQNENREPMKLDCLLDSHDLNNNSNSKISNLACSNELLVCGTFEGGYILVNPSNNEVIGEHNIANNVNGITNHIVIDDTNNQLIVASNDKFIRLIDLNLSSKYSASVSQMYEFPFAINCVANNQRNLNEILFTGDDTKSYIIDKRQPQNVFTSCLIGHEDYGFSCDWSPTNENLILTGNQDGSVKLWDRRMLFPKGKGNDNSLYSWDSSLGRECCAGINIGASSTTIGGPVRNAKFSTQGDYISWAESLDHIGIIPTEELLTGKEISRLDRIQSIEFIGKCTGLSFAPTENGYGEELIIGVNDNPLGGILSYRLGSKGKSLDFDFHF